MRKDTKRIVTDSFNDLLGGLYNSFLDGILEEDDLYDNLNTKDALIEWVYQDAINCKKEIKFDTTQTIKEYIEKLIDNDEDILEVLEFLEKKTKN